MMKIKSVKFHSQFTKHLQKYSGNRKKIDESIRIFLSNTSTTSLRTHKLSGKLKNYFSFSVDYHLRIIFKFLREGAVYFLDIGTHEIYK